MSNSLTGCKIIILQMKAILFLLTGKHFYTLTIKFVGGSDLCNKYVSHNEQFHSETDQNQ